MGFVEAVRTCVFRKYADCQGRASRAEYWWFAVFAVVVPFVGFNSWRRFPGLLVAGAAVALVTVIPHLAVTVRRLHDTDRSGWWALLGLVGPLAGFLESAGWIGHLVLLWFLIQKSDVLENRYGPNPAPDALLSLSGRGRSAPRDQD